MPKFYYTEDEGPVMTGEITSITIEQAEELINVFSSTYLCGLGFHEAPETGELVDKLHELGLLECEDEI